MTRITKYQLLQLLEKQKLGICTEAEEKMLTEWFDEVPQIDELTFASVEEKEKIRSEMADVIKEKINQDTSGIKSTKVRKLWSISVAAAVLIGISIMGLYFFLQKEQTTEMVVVSVPQGIDHMPVILPDSSQVTLSGGSSISYPGRFEAGARKVKLTGMAYFSVHPDKKAPFTVSTPSAVSVRVLGTSFVVDVRKEKERVEISVITGLVQIDEAKKKLDVLRPGEKMLYSCIDKTFSKKIYRSEEVAEWQNNSTVYLNMVSLSEISVLLHTMYHVNLNFDQKKMGHYRFNMSFSRSLAVDEVLDMLHTVSGLNFARAGKEVKIND
jgi:transmembrane sensor